MQSEDSEYDERQDLQLYDRYVSELKARGIRRGKLSPSAEEKLIEGMNFDIFERAKLLSYISSKCDRKEFLYCVESRLLIKERSLFRSMLWSQLRSERLYPSGTCEYVNEKGQNFIKIRFFIDGRGTANGVNLAIMTVAKMCYPEVEHQTTTIESGWFPASALWFYEHSEHRLSARNKAPPAPPDGVIVDIKLSVGSPTIAKDSSTTADNAHIIPQQQWKDGVEFLARHLPADLDKIFLKARTLTIQVGAAVHRLFDRPVFYFAWKYDVESKSLHLVPKLTSELLERDSFQMNEGRHLYSFVHIADGELEAWILALGIRKHLTYLALTNKFHEPSFHFDITAPQSSCYLY